MEVDVPEFLADAAQHKDATEQMKAAVDFSLIGYYYFLRVDENTEEGLRNESK